MKRRLDHATSLTLIVLTMIGGCAMRTIAPYDDGVAQGLADLHSRVSCFFDELQNDAGTPNGSWESFADCYEAIRADIESVRQRAASRPNNELTLQSLDLLSANLDDVEAAHRQGLTSGEIPILRSVLDTQVRMLVRLEDGKKRPARAEVLP